MTKIIIEMIIIIRTKYVIYQPMTNVERRMTVDIMLWTQTHA